MNASGISAAISATASPASAQAKPAQNTAADLFATLMQNVKHHHHHGIASPVAPTPGSSATASAGTGLDITA